MDNSLKSDGREFSELKKEVRNAYIWTGRDQRLDSCLRELVVNTEDWKNGVGSKRRSLFLIGDSGSGKSFALRHHFARIEAFQPYVGSYGETVCPLLSIEAPSPCNTKELAKAILSAMNLPTTDKMSEQKLFAMLKAQLRERGVVFLHVDEMQHVLRHNTAAAIQNVQDTLKSLVQAEDWPLHTIYSGVPTLAEFLKGDRQLANRARVMRFEALEYPEDSKWIADILNQIAWERCGLKLDESLTSADFIGRLCRACAGGLGTMVQMIQEACFLAIPRGAKTLMLKDFSRNYARDTGCSRGDNVVTSSNWEELDVDNSLADLAPAKQRASKK